MCFRRSFVSNEWAVRIIDGVFPPFLLKGRRFPYIFLRGGGGRLITVFIFVVLSYAMGGGNRHNIFLFYALAVWTIFRLVGGGGQGKNDRQNHPYTTLYEVLVFDYAECLFYMKYSRYISILADRYTYNTYELCFSNINECGWRAGVRTLFSPPFHPPFFFAASAFQVFRFFPGRREEQINRKIDDTTL